MKFEKCYSLIVALFFVSGINAQTLTPTYANVDYVGNGNSKQMMDIYIPSNVTTAVPCIVHIHGGAFLGGSKGTSEQSSYKTYYNNGWVCVDINYRLSGDSIYPSQIYDCKTAIRFLKKNASLYKIDTNRIGLIGESAGGYLVSMVGTSWHNSSLEGLHLGSTGVTSKVAAVVDLFGPTNFLMMDGHEGIGCASANHNAANSPESMLLGCALPTCPELVENANPLAYINASTPPFYISCGDHDCLVAPYSSFIFDSALTAASRPHTYELVAGLGHGGSFWHTAAQETKYLNFFNQSFAATNIDDETKTGSVSPIKFSLGENYPNPFNPETVITYSVEEKSNVHIRVFGLLGEEVATLINEEKPTGNYTVRFNGSSLSSGVYICVMEAGSFLKSQKLVLMK
ncbi:MAG: alpha/beta hydrolase fold domain-containing protein [Ignavibacteriales bacterium]|nr:alpha/beta hydrolase fold domain-containing protein [Ignavibacteriales bacterium]